MREAWHRAPGPCRGAHTALRDLTGKKMPTGTDALQHPASPEMHFDDSGKPEALRAWCAGLLASLQPSHHRGEAQASRSKALQEEWDAQNDGPERPQYRRASRK